jgi:hypothetical protein
MAATVTSVGNSYTQVAADVTAMKYIACIAAGDAMIELANGSSAPADTVRGLPMYPGQKMLVAEVTAIWAANKLYAIRKSGDNVRVAIE